MKELLLNQVKLLFFFLIIFTAIFCINMCFASTETTFELTEPSILDTDGDMIPDDWEIKHSLNPLDATDADLDYDGDRQTNRDEFYANSNPHVFSSADKNNSSGEILSDRQILNLFKGKAFLFFWEHSYKPYYFTADSGKFNNKNYRNWKHSIASTGFAILSYITAIENNWIDKHAAYNRIQILLSRIVELQNEQSETKPLSPAGREGYLYHWTTDYGYKWDTSEISNIDHAFLVGGALCAGEYFKGTKVETLAEEIYKNTNWKWFYGAQDPRYLAMGWQSEYYEWENRGAPPSYGGVGYLTNYGDSWNRYSELLLLLFLAMGESSDYCISEEAWNNLKVDNQLFYYNRVDISSLNNQNLKHLAFMPNMPDIFFDPNGYPKLNYDNNNVRFRYMHAGSLHNHQYSHMYIDFRNRPSKNLNEEVNFFLNSLNASMANRQFCIKLKEYKPFDYESYSEDCWGLMAGVSSRGYIVMQPPLDGTCDDLDVAINTDSGTIVPSAPLGSTCFIPRQAADFARSMLDKNQKNISWFNDVLGRYGFANAFNPGKGFKDRLYKDAFSFIKDATPNGMNILWDELTTSGYISTEGFVEDKFDKIEIDKSVHDITLNDITEFSLSPQFIQDKVEIFKRLYTGGHFCDEIISLDLGPIVGNIENDITGLIWKFMMRNNFIKNGMQKCEFDTGLVEPNVITFESFSHPNLFGGFDEPFGTGTEAYYTSEEKHSGTYSYKITTYNNTDSGAFITLNNHSVSNFDMLAFWIKTSNSTPVDFKVGLKDHTTDKLSSSMQTTEVKLPIKNYLKSGITQEWQEVKIPLNDFVYPENNATAEINVLNRNGLKISGTATNSGVSTTSLDNISFSCTTKDGGTIFIDDITFTDDFISPDAPLGLEFTINGNNTILSWTPSKEKDVCGYNIYRKTPQESTFTKINTTLNVPAAFIDKIENNAFEYYITAVDNSIHSNESTQSNIISTFINIPPSIESITNKTVYTNAAISFNILATDQNQSDILTITGSVNGNPLNTIGAKLEPLSNNKSIFTWTPNSSQGTKTGINYNFTFTVNDEHGGEASTHMVITVLKQNTAPTAIAKSSLSTTQIGKTITLDGSESSDPDNDNLEYFWTIKSKPNNSTATITNSTSAQSLFIPDIAGTYTFELTVTDTGALANTAQITIIAETETEIGTINGNITLFKKSGEKESTHGGIKVYFWGRTSEKKYYSLIQIQTDADGNFTLRNIPSGKYRILIRANEYRFSPYIKSINYNSAQPETVTFTGTALYNSTTPPAYGEMKITGALVNIKTQEPLANIKINLTGKTITRKPIRMQVLTNEKGEYSFGNLSKGEYKVYPHQYGWKFYPAYKRIMLLTENKIGENFRGYKRRPWYYIFTRLFHH